MRPGPVRIVAGGSRRDGTVAVPGAGRRGRVRVFVLAAAAGLAVVAGAMTGTTAAHAAASVPAAHTAAAAQSHTMFEPCPCDRPICRPGCLQSMASGGAASMVLPRTHLAAAQALARMTASAVSCPPPSEPVASQDGQPSC